MKLVPLAAAAALALAAAPTGPAAAAPIAPVAAPSGANTEIGARIRWGGSGFEASLFDPDFGTNGTINQSVNLNRPGAPAWQVGRAYGFQIDFTSATGALGLAIDFNRNNSFQPFETISRSVFAAPDLVSYTGFGFETLWISARQSGTARSQITDLTINGSAQTSLTPAAGTGISRHYAASHGNPIADWLITGNITFLTAGTSQESPAWDFKFLDAGTPRGADPAEVPLPAALGLFALAVAGFAAARAMREASPHPLDRAGS
jgi:hypothetical protein